MKMTAALILQIITVYKVEGLLQELLHILLYCLLHIIQFHFNQKLLLAQLAAQGWELGQLDICSTNRDRALRNKKKTELAAMETGDKAKHQVPSGKFNPVDTLGIKSCRMVQIPTLNQFSIKQCETASAYVAHSCSHPHHTVEVISCYSLQRIWHPDRCHLAPYVVVLCVVCMRGEGGKVDLMLSLFCFLSQFARLKTCVVVENNKSLYRAFQHHCSKGRFQHNHNIRALPQRPDRTQGSRCERG